MYFGFGSAGLFQVEVLLFSFSLFLILHSPLPFLPLLHPALQLPNPEPEFLVAFQGFCCMVIVGTQKIQSLIHSQSANSSSESPGSSLEWFFSLSSQAWKLNSMYLPHHKIISSIRRGKVYILVTTVYPVHKIVSTRSSWINEWWLTSRKLYLCSWTWRFVSSHPGRMVSLVQRKTYI